MIKIRIKRPVNALMSKKHGCSFPCTWIGAGSSQSVTTTYPEYLSTTLNQSPPNTASEFEVDWFNSC